MSPVLPLLLCFLASFARAESKPNLEIPRLVPPVLAPETVARYEVDDSTPALQKALMAGSKPEEAYDGAGDKPDSGGGLRILGLEFSGDRGAPEKNEPYNSKGLARALDWDVRARVALDGLGARAKYRNPNGLRNIQVGFLKYWDWPEVLGVGGARDDIYGAAGTRADKPTGGFELGVSGALNEYMGGATTYDERSGRQGDRIVNRRSLNLTAGWSPLGDNPGKPWNITLLLGGGYVERSVYAPTWMSDRAGLAGSVGLAYQRALQDVAPAWLKRVKVKGWGEASAVHSAAVNASTELTVNLVKGLDVTGGVAAKWTPKPEAGNPEEESLAWSGIFGLDFAY